jgi:hypothetical protein
MRRERVGVRRGGSLCHPRLFLVIPVNTGNQQCKHGEPVNNSRFPPAREREESVWERQKGGRGNDKRGTLFWHHAAPPYSRGLNRGVY